LGFFSGREQELLQQAKQKLIDVSWTYDLVLILLICNLFLNSFWKVHKKCGFFWTGVFVDFWSNYEIICRNEKLYK
jgi:hypothetical protein